MKSENLLVSSKSSPRSIAGAIAYSIMESDNVIIKVVGAGALNQAVKAIIIARGYVAPTGYNLSCVPSFCDVETEDGTKTGITLVVHKSLVWKMN